VTRAVTAWCRCTSGQTGDSQVVAAVGGGYRGERAHGSFGRHCDCRACIGRHHLQGGRHRPRGRRPIWRGRRPLHRHHLRGQPGNLTVSVIDGATNEVTSTIGVGNNPLGVGVDPATDAIYVSNTGDGYRLCHRRGHE